MEPIYDSSIHYSAALLFPQNILQISQEIRHFYFWGFGLIQYATKISVTPIVSFMPLTSGLF